MIAFEKYSKIRNNYCICYFGYSDEYLVQLRLLKPLIEHRFPGLNLCFGCRDDRADLLRGCNGLLIASRIKAERENFAHIRELRYNGRSHPVEDLLEESQIQQRCVHHTIKPRETDKCVIIAEGNYPTVGLTKAIKEQLQRMAKDEGFGDIQIGGDISGASLVLGTESVQLFEAAGQGIRTILVPTGVGTRLYKSMFPNAEVLHR